MSLFGIRVGFTAEYMTSFATNNKNEILFIPIINADFPSYFQHKKLCTKSGTLWSDCQPVWWETWELSLSRRLCLDSGTGGDWGNPGTIFTSYSLIFLN